MSHYTHKSLPRRCVIDDARFTQLEQSMPPGMKQKFTFDQSLFNISDGKT